MPNLPSHLTIIGPKINSNPINIFSMILRRSDDMSLIPTLTRVLNVKDVNCWVINNICFAYDIT